MRREAAVISVLTAAALGLGTMTIAWTVDIPGDGPTRAMSAYIWSLHPHLETHGIWLPGPDYVMGICLMVIGDPLLVPRVFNLIVGTLTVPAFYVLVRKLYGTNVATLSSVTLAVLPLRVGLSASSLTEASFLFYLIASILCLAWAVESSSIRIVPLLLALGCLVLAEMTRYEAWPLIPLFVCYLYIRSRNLLATVLAGALLMAFPVAWSATNYHYFGELLYGFRSAANPVEGGARVGLSVAIANLATKSRDHLGLLLGIASAAGLTLECYRTVRGSIGFTRSAYAALMGVEWVIILTGALSLGPALFDRFLLLGFTLVLPMAAVAYFAIFGSYRWGLAIGVLLFTTSIGLAYVRDNPHQFVTREKPTDVIELVNWLKSSPYRDSPIITTKIDWQSTYLELYAVRELGSDVAGRYFVTSAWTRNEWLRSYLRYNRLGLLMTKPEDAGDRVHIERVLGRPLPIVAPVHVSGRIEVYDISSVTSEVGN